MANHYATLGVSRDASRREIVQAYRWLVRRHHPDAGGDPARFREVQAAYDVLRDARTRALYDATLAPPPPPPQRATTRVHRYGTPPPVTLPPPSPGSCGVAIALASVALAGLAAPLAAAHERRAGIAVVCLLVALVCAAAARSVAATELDRVWRFRALWAYGFALPDAGAEDEVDRCQRLASLATAFARVVPRAAPLVGLGVLFALAG